MTDVPPSSAMSPATRRGFLRTLARLGAAGVLAPPSRLFAESPHPSPADLALPSGSETVGILLYPGFTTLDAIGPEYFLSGIAGAKVRLVGKTTEAVRTESGFAVKPHWSFGDCPASLSLFLVPGGMDGTLAAIRDPETLDFVRRTGAAAEIAASVCTGSLLLGAAGLLRGYRATSHWQAVDLLSLVGATPVRERLVFDRNRATAAGVTAGLDFALELLRRYRGDAYAQGMQLLAQYDPQPPFPNAGNPQKADPAIVALLEHMHRPFLDIAAQTLREAKIP